MHTTDHADPDPLAVESQTPPPTRQRTFQVADRVIDFAGEKGEVLPRSVWNVPEDLDAYPAFVVVAWDAGGRTLHSPAFLTLDLTAAPDGAEEAAGDEPWPVREYTTIVTTNGTVHDFETAGGTCTTCGKPAIDHPVTIQGEPATILAVFPDSLRVRYPGVPDMLAVPLDEPDGSKICHDDVWRRCSCRGGEPDGAEGAL